MSTPNSASPLSSFPAQPLTPSGLLSLDTSDGEVEVETRSFVELRSLTQVMSSSSSWKDRDTDLKMTLTTHKIVFQSTSSSSSPPSHFLHLSNVQSHSDAGGDWFTNSSYKIEIETSTHGKFYLVFRSRYGKADRDTFYTQLKKALNRRQWEEASRLHPNGIGTSSATTGANVGVGVAAIVERNRLKHEHNAKLANQVFGGGASASNSNSRSAKKEREREVETLMREARELTAVIHKYVATLEKNSKQKDGNDDDDADNEELTSMLSHMGMITSIPSKNESSTAYYDTLARQICDFLSQNKSFSIAKGGTGIMTLTDVYCLFNRARGANMISPEDLITALEKMERLGLKMKVREFDNGSGVSVVQETGFDDSIMVKKILDFVDKSNDGRRTVGLTALEAGRILKISPLLAKEQLMSAEQSGYLCRDVTVEGTRFFCNLFISD